MITYTLEEAQIEDFSASGFRGSHVRFLETELIDI